MDVLTLIEGQVDEPKKEINTMTCQLEEKDDDNQIKIKNHLT